jgi:replicative DNA helicase
MLLLGARPGHGKTLLGLEMLLDAAADGRRAVLFTLESYEREARERISALNHKNHGIAEKLEIVTSDDICADYILQYLAGSPCKAVAVIDYLQLLDQKRSKPALADQMLVLQRFASRSAAILVFISQIDRFFVPKGDSMPSIQDIRLPNPIGSDTFSKACFLHDGEIRLHNVA